MSFLTSNDYNKQIKPEQVTQITESDDTIIPAAELAAQEKIESYLNQLFDVTTIFSASGTSRNPLIIELMVDLVLYDIMSRLPSRNIPQQRIDRHEIALVTLDKIRAGKVTPNLPRLIDQHGLDVKDFRFGGDFKQENQTPWY